MHIVPDYPQELNQNQIEIAFAVALPAFVTLQPNVTHHFIPQSTLLLVGLQLSPVLATLSGSYIIGISAYKPTPPQDSQIVTGIAIVFTLLGLIIVGVLAG